MERVVDSGRGQVVEGKTWWWWIGGGDEGVVRGKGQIVLVANGGVEGMASCSVDKVSSVTVSNKYL